jgi:Zn-dependent protease with chaperone function
MSAQVPSGEPHDHDPRWLERLNAAAIEAEYETGRRESTAEEARRGVIIRLARIIGGFTIIGVGLAGLLLPGPGWVMIIFGLSLLPFAWAERTVLLIRRKVPGVPEEGTIPLRTWIIMGLLLVVFTTLSLLFGDDITRWLSGLWGDPDRLLG